MAPNVITVSMVKHAHATKCSDVNLFAVLEAIKASKWKRPVHRVRKAFAQGGKAAAEPLKKRLPGVTFSGRFRQRKASELDKHSGVLCVDLDNLNGDLDAIREKLAQDKHVMACFVSPTGSGLKVLTPIQASAGSHEGSFRAARRHFQDRYGITIDESCKDVARLCFVSADPDMFIRDSAEVLWPEPEAQQEPPDPLQDCIILPSGPVGLYKSAERVFTILARSDELFLRGDRVFELVESDNGLLRLNVISEQTFRSRIERYGKVVAWRAGPHGGWLLKEDARCSLDNATVWLASDAKNILPLIAAVHGCPIITETENGIEVLGKGYHKECGGRLVTGGAMPKQTELKEAVRRLIGRRV